MRESTPACFHEKFKNSHKKTNSISRCLESIGTTDSKMKSPKSTFKMQTKLGFLEFNIP